MKFFSQRVLAIVSDIPKGCFLTYREVAIRAGSPGAFRAVGNILNKNSDPRIACHRVICSNGRVGGYNKGAIEKLRILFSEGLVINSQGRVVDWSKDRG